MDMYMYLTLPTRPRTYWSMALFFSALLTPVLNCIPNTFGCCLNHLILLNIKFNKLKEWLKKRNFIYHSWHMKFSLSNTTSKILHTITCNNPPPQIDYCKLQLTSYWPCRLPVEYNGSWTAVQPQCQLPN